MHCPLAFSPLCTDAQPFRRFRIDSSRIQTGFKQAPPEAAGSYQKRKASNLIQRFIHHLTVAGDASESPRCRSTGPHRPVPFEGENLVLAATRQQQDTGSLNSRRNHRAVGFRPSSSTRPSSRYSSGERNHSRGGPCTVAPNRLARIPVRRSHPPSFGKPKHPGEHIQYIVGLGGLVPQLVVEGGDMGPIHL